MAPNISITLTKNGLTVNGTITSDVPIYTVEWTSDDFNHAVGTSITFTYKSYGTKSILITYKDGSQTSYGTTRTITLTDPIDNPDVEDVTLDVFADKPVYIQPECTGDIRITANIEKLSNVIEYTPDNKVSAWTASINFANVDNLTTGLEFVAGETKDFYVDAASHEGHPSDDWIVVDDMKIENLKYIPAFYNSGNVTTEIRLLSSDDINSNFDVSCNMYIQFPDYPDWYEGTLTYNSVITNNLISSDNSETLIPSAGVGASNIINFTINTFPGMPPVELKDAIDYNKDDFATQTAIERACLSTPQFWFEITNNLESSVYIGNISIRFAFYYNENGLLMNARTEGAKSQESYQLFTLPKGAETTRLSGLNFPLFGVIDGFKLGEVVKVFGYYARWDSNNEVYIPTCLTLYPIESSASSDHPAVLYKSYLDVSEAPLHGIAQYDFERLAYKGTSQDDYCKVLTPQLLASEDHWRSINVKCKDASGTYGASCDASDTVFEINTSPNSSIDEEITEEDLTTYIDALYFFGIEKDFALTVDVNRAEIDNVFRERLYTTYKDAPLLQSTFGEPLNFVYFTINEYGKYFPIEHGKTLEFSDNLVHAPTDGVKSSDIFIYSNTTPNVFGIQNPKKNKYRVKFAFSYDVYQDCYVIRPSDFGAE